MEHLVQRKSDCGGNNGIKSQKGGRVCKKYYVVVVLSIERSDIHNYFLCAYDITAFDMETFQEQKYLKSDT